MTVFPWDEVYSVGVESVDLQHRELVQAVGLIDQLVARGAPLAELLEAFEALYRQTELHFRHEEKLFNGTRFHRARNHKRTHQALLLILRRFCQSLRAEDLAAAPAAHICFVRGWLIDHIRSEDYVMGVHLNTLAKR